jgi:hypothetical protein
MAPRAFPPLARAKSANSGLEIQNPVTRPPGARLRKPPGRSAGVYAALLAGALLLPYSPAPAQAWSVRQAVAASPGSSGTGQAAEDVRRLEPGERVEREIRKGEGHSYRLTLDAGQYLRLVIDQKGVDLSATLSAETL